MNQNLKQRLVGLIVLTSLLVIFLPMLFDDPINETGELTIPDVPINLLPGDTENNIKTIDDVIKLSKPETIKESIDQKQAASKLIRWFIQMGSFNQKSNAILLRDKIRQQGFPVTIKTVVSRKKSLLYKVIVGPELDQKRAEAMKAKIARLNNIKGILSSAEQ